MVVCCQQKLCSLKIYLLNLNLFENLNGNGERADDQQRRSCIIASRVYVLLLSLALITIGLVSWLIPQTTIVTIDHPTKEKFQALPADVECSCSRTSISYGEFTSIQASFHQVCSSDFISDRWIAAIDSGSTLSYLFWQDFRFFGTGQFQALASFCRLSKSNVGQSIALFVLTTLLSPQMLTETVLRSRIQSQIDQLQLTAPNEFGSQLSLVREMTRSNLIQSGLQANVDLHYEYYSERLAFIYSRVVQRECDCRINIDCVFESGIFNLFGQPGRHLTENVSALMNIPGFVTGCLPVDGVLSSTLECFYSQSCVNRLISFLFKRERFTAITVVNESRFSLNSTVKSMVDSLMVEEWTENISYDKYYAQCAPTSCTYSKVQRHSLVFVLTKVIGVLSGLSLALRLAVPLLVQYIQRLPKRERTPKIPRKLSAVRSIVVIHMCRALFKLRFTDETAHVMMKCPLSVERLIEEDWSRRYFKDGWGYCLL